MAMAGRTSLSAIASWAEGPTTYWRSGGMPGTSVLTEPAPADDVFLRPVGLRGIHRDALQTRASDHKLSEIAGIFRRDICATLLRPDLHFLRQAPGTIGQRPLCGHSDQE